MSWGKQCVFGHETIENENKKRLVNFIWCKVCRKHEQSIRRHSDLKGQGLESALAMACGTNVITKYQVNVNFIDLIVVLLLHKILNVEGQEGSGQEGSGKEE